MGIKKWRHRGQARLVLSKTWPDQTRFRRFMPNKTVAKELERRIDYAILTGTWQELKAQLQGGNSTDEQPTVASFSSEYLVLCRSRNRDFEFKERQVAQIINVLGDVKLSEFKRRHADHFVEARKKSGVGNATVNRGVAVLKNMLTVAVQREYLDIHPLIRYRLLPEVQKALQILSYEEYRQLTSSVLKEDPVIGAYTIFLGETGARKQEGLHLKWKDLDFARRIVSIGETKSGKRRSIPLSDYAIECLGSLVRFLKIPGVFVDTNRQKTWRDPRGPFDHGRKAVGLDWVSFHDLRHFRATQWLSHGVDVNTVKELLGHSSIQTTMRYVHYLQSHAVKAVTRAQRKELKEWG